MPITNITHSACYTVEMGVSAWVLTRITLENNHTAYMHICLQGISCVCVKNYPPEIMQPSSSTRATIVSAEIKMVQPSSRPHFSFAIITSYGNQITPAKHEDNLEMKVWNPDESQEDRAVIRVVQSENILLRFLRRGHADDHRAVPPPVTIHLTCHHDLCESDVWEI